MGQEIFSLSKKAMTQGKSRSPILKAWLWVIAVGLSTAWIHRSIQPPPPKICGTAGGPPITSPRIKLRDGRHLAYLETGKPSSEHRIIFIHGFDCCRYDVFPISEELMVELGIYILSFDRAGYGESDPDPKKSPKSTALDIQELADQRLGADSKFYVMGFSMGGQLAWACLKYIPHRLSGAALVAPVANYWWPGFPANLSKEAYGLQHAGDWWALEVSHHAPWLVYWWNTQRWFPSSSVVAHSLHIFSPPDLLLRDQFESRTRYVAQIRQQGEHESLHRDMIVGFGTWDFDPTALENPFPGREGSPAVHLWHGMQDFLVPVALSRYISQRHPWIRYHELPQAGHMFPLADGMADLIVRELLSS